MGGGDRPADDGALEARSVRYLSSERDEVMLMICGKCGAENAAEARFCNQCATALEAATITAERRQITVFFSDLSGYTALSEQLDAEEVRSIMNGIFGRAREIVEKYGGRIDKFLGDAVMAVFGDPTVHEDDAERAVRAVLELHDAVDEMSAQIEPTIGRPIAMHTGINTGLVVTSGAEFDNAVGDAINVAARLEDLSESGEILLGPETARLVAGAFALVDHGTHELKGKSGPVPITKVRGLATVRAEPSRRRGAFVGRHEELGVLLSAVERMRDGESSLITIRAGAGVGKTRLLSEFRSRLPAEVQWLEGRAYAYGENIPYAAIIDLLRHAIAINEDDDPATVEAKLRASVADLVDDVDLVYAPLARLFGLAVPEAAALDRETYQHRLLESVLQMTEALACRAPTVLTLQDLHWADPSTVRLVGDLIERLETPVVAVANYRPGFELDVRGRRELTLGELSPRQTGELLESLLDGVSASRELVDFIVTRSDGNPFFVEEIVNSLIETGGLRDGGDGWRVAGDLEEMDLPTSIRGVIAARIDRLDDRRRRVLREASVVGREFLYDVVRRVTTVRGELLSSLSGLEAADLIREKAVDPDLEYFFKHALTQEVAYDGLLKSEREQLHARCAAAIEAQFVGRLEEVTETLAYHWLHSGVSAKAVSSLIAAGRKAMERFALDESRVHFRNAYEVLAAEPESEARDRGLVDLLLEWAFLAYYQARLYDLRELLVAHQDSVDRIGDAEEQGMWTAWIGHGYLAADGDFGRATDLLDGALEMGRAHNSVRVIAYAQAWRVYTLWWLGRVDEAIVAGREGPELAAELSGEPYPWFKGRCGLGMALAHAGQFAEARSIGDELISFGERTGSARAQAMGHLVLVNLASVTLDEPAAARHTKAATAAADDPIYDHAPVAPRLFTLIAAGKVEEARRLHDDHQRRYVDGLHVNMLAGWLGIADGLIKLQEGHLEEGFARLEAVEQRAIRSGELIYEHYARMALALAYAEVAMSDASLGDQLRRIGFALGRGRRARREAYARLDALTAELEHTGWLGWRFNLEWTYARLLAHAGDDEAAVRHLETAIDVVAPAGATEGLRLARELRRELEG
jgi:class 3 adenylate cyclase